MKEKMLEWWDRFYDESKHFVKETGKDFVSVWKLYPNVLIWCAIAFLLAVFV